MSLLLTPDYPELEYRRRADEEKKACPWGQRKLCIVELLFLTRYWNKETVPSPIMVYAGAAPGKHIYFLANCFPAFTFHLYDPAEFQIVSTQRVICHREFFTDDTAKLWSGRSDIFFVSDVRMSNYETRTPLENEKNIWEEMEAQRRWAEIISPISSLLKFRLPYAGFNLPFVKEGKVEYLDGDVYFQPWSPQTTTETRLVPNGKVKNWDIKKYESQLFHHNVVVRESQNFPHKVIDTSREILNDYDSFFEVTTIEEYLAKTGRRMSILEMSQELTRSLNEGKKKETQLTLSLIRQDVKVMKKRYNKKEEKSEKIEEE